MAALLHDFATDAGFRTKVREEFTATKGLFGDYLTALRPAYPIPAIR